MKSGLLGACSALRLWIRSGVCLLAVLFCATLSGCGTHYTVSVDSLRVAHTEDIPRVCAFEPGNPGVNPDDLLFLDVCRMIGPAFTARGFTVTSPEEAPLLVRVSYWVEAPQTILEPGIERRTVPVLVRNGRRRRMDYVRIEETHFTSRTVYTAVLLLEARDSHRQLWRTEVRSTGPVGNLRSLLASMVPVLQEMLGTRTEGDKRFEVVVDDSGKTTVDELFD